METPRLEAVRIRRGIVDDLLAHASDEAPNECCGLLLGRTGLVERARRARNLQESPARFLIDPADHFAAMREAREAGLRVIGAYHSHPHSPPVPSETDMAEAIDEELLHIIVSPGTPGAPGEARGFRMLDGNFREVRLVLVA
jgi:proteasome lid subunit RPN8/RPN11